jgi:hypothetical protein
MRGPGGLRSGTMASRSPSIPARMAIAVGVVALLLAGLWVAAGLIAPTYLTSIGFGVVWFVLASVALGQVGKRRPDLKWTVRGTFLATAAATGAVFAWTSLRDDTVNEKVLVGVPAAQLPRALVTPGKPIAAGAPRMNVALAKGTFQVADEGSASGTATLVRKAAGGRVLTLTQFAVNNGPDLRVYLVPGDGKDTGRRVDLGGLKGNRGNQQYDVPGSADTGRYRTVVIWCRAFSVAFARATLRPE